LDFIHNQGVCSDCLGQTQWKSPGGEFNPAFDWRTGTFQGEQFALCCFNPKTSSGFVNVDWFKFSDNSGQKEKP
jgi:hypothetical protein